MAVDVVRSGAAACSLAHATTYNLCKAYNVTSTSIKTYQGMQSIFKCSMIFQEVVKYDADYARSRRCWIKDAPSPRIVLICF